MPGGSPADTRAVQLSVTDRGVQVLTAARAKVLNLEEQRLVPLGGRDSPQSAQLREALGVLLRHTQTMRRTDEDGQPAPSSADRPQT